jgi:Na+-transporting NADH:ubiquinone oxidoreductase subunit A
MGKGRQFSIPRGRDLVVSPPPRQQIGPSAPVTGAGLELRDCRGVQPALRVQLGDAVRAGQILFVDARRPAIAFVAPVSGTVSELRRGPRGELAAVMLACDAATHGTQAFVDATAPEPTRDGLRSALQRHGLWSAFATRPFGDIPDPQALPVAILVTAMDTRPLAADARVVIAAHRAAFERGVQALQLLTDGRVQVCQAPGPLLAPTAVVFTGRHPAGLPGSHVQQLCKAELAEPEAQVWTVGYQDAIAIGYLAGSSKLWTERVISLAGPAVREPRLLTVPLGARLEDVAAGELGSRGARLVSGSPLDGQHRELLGRHHLQVSALFDPRPVRPGPIIPVAALERALPGCPAPVPLLRALSTGDVAGAVRLGALDLLEDDLALASHACASRTDYGALLRHVLEQSRATGADPVAELDPLAAYACTPPLHALRSNVRVGSAQAAAVAPVLLGLGLHAGARPLGVFAVALSTALAWQVLFGRLRGRAMAEWVDLHAIVTAVGLAALLPLTIASWQVALGASFGVVMAELVFGGYGFNFLSPAVAALAFVGFSFPELAHEPLPALNVAWVAPGALLLLASGIANLRVLVGLGVGGAGALFLQLLLGGGRWPTTDSLGTLAFAAVFLAADPVASAATQPGRWAYGLLAGGLLGLMLARGAPGFAFAILLAQLFAPLLDQLALSLLTRPRRVAHG